MPYDLPPHDQVKTTLLSTMIPRPANLDCVTVAWAWDGLVWKLQCVTVTDVEHDMVTWTSA